MTATHHSRSRAAVVPPDGRVCMRGRIDDRKAAAHAGDGVFPVAAVRFKDWLRSSCSRSVQQRFSLRRRAEDERVWETTCALNAMAASTHPRWS